MADDKIDLASYLHVLYLEHMDIDHDNPNYATSQAVCRELESALFVAETGLNPVSYPGALEGFAERVREEALKDLER